jgi:hypothetical protein
MKKGCARLRINFPFYKTKENRVSKDFFSKPNMMPQFDTFSFFSQLS